MAAGKEAEATTELRRILDLDENYYLAYSHLAVIETSGGRPAEALTLIEKAYALAPWLHGNSGLRAGLLIRAGDANLASETLERLGDGQAYGAPLGFMAFHLVCQEIDKAADWAEKGIGQRDPAVILFLRGPLARDSAVQRAVAGIGENDEFRRRGSWSDVV